MPLQSQTVSVVVKLTSSSRSRTCPVHSSAVVSRPAEHGVASYISISSVRSHMSSDDTSNTKSSSNSGHVVRLWTCSMYVNKQHLVAVYVLWQCTRTICTAVVYVQRRFTARSSTQGLRLLSAASSHGKALPNRSFHSLLLD